MQDNNYNPYTNPSGGVPVPPQPPVYSAVPFEGMEPPAGYPQKSRLAALAFSAARSACTISIWATASAA